MQAHFKWVAILLFLLPAGLPAAEPKAVIDGLKQSTPGDLVILRTTGSVGTGFAWNIVPPEAKNFAYVTDGGKTCLFARSKSGKFTFVLAVTAMDTDVISTTTHVLVNGGGKPNDEEEEEEEEDDLTPEDDWAKWAKATAERTVDMPAGGPRANAAKAIAGALESTVNTASQSNIDIQECREMLARKTSAAVSAEVQRKWSGFSIEMDREIRKITGMTKGQWLKVIKSISNGLKTVR